jgi:hypothetical protein
MSLLAIQCHQRPKSNKYMEMLVFRKNQHMIGLEDLPCRRSLAPPMSKNRKINISILGNSLLLYTLLDVQACRNNINIPNGRIFNSNIGIVV